MSADYSAAFFGIGGTLLGVAVGHGLTWWRDRSERVRVKRGNLRALKAEILYCSSLAGTYLTAGYGVPSYRAPTIVYENSFPALLTQGFFSEADAAAVLEFYVNVKALNRGLDYAQAQIGSPVALQPEVSRAMLKAQHLVPGTSANPTRYDVAIAAIARHLPDSDAVRPMVGASEAA